MNEWMNESRTQISHALHKVFPDCLAGCDSSFLWFSIALLVCIYFLTQFVFLWMHDDIFSSELQDCRVSYFFILSTVLAMRSWIGRGSEREREACHWCELIMISTNAVIAGIKEKGRWKKRYNKRDSDLITGMGKQGEGRVMTSFWFEPLKC